MRFQRSPRADETLGAGCSSEKCPRCGTAGYVTVERVIVGTARFEQCHCKACGASWKVEPSPKP